MFRKRTGFTLIELLIVVLIVGVLAAIAIPRFAFTKGKAYSSAVRSDLRNVLTAEESYLTVHGTYSNDLTKLEVTLSNGVKLEWGEVTRSGWSARTTHPAADPFACAVYVGTAPALAPAAEESRITCENMK